MIAAEAQGSHSEPGDYALRWYAVAKETLTSRVIEFPNEIRKGDQIRLNNGHEGLSELVQGAYHNIAGNYTVLDIGKHVVRDEDSEEKAKQKFSGLLEKYSFIRNL